MQNVGLLADQLFMLSEVLKYSFKPCAEVFPDGTKQMSPDIICIKSGVELNDY